MTVRVRCDACGPVELDADRVTVVRRQARDDARFDCPRCGSVGSTPLDRRTAAALRATDARLVIDGIDGDTGSGPAENADEDDPSPE